MVDSSFSFCSLAKQMYWYVLCVWAERPDGSGVFGGRKHTFLKPGPRVNQTRTALCVFVFVFVWTPDTQTMTSSPPYQAATLEFRLNWFVWFVLFFVLSTQSKRFKKCFLHLVFFFYWWKPSGTQWPWTCTTEFLQLDAFPQWVCLYGDIHS